jgi:hypothetical protein
MPMQRHTILTPRIRRAQYELLDALKESINQSDLEREVVQGKLSAVISDIWNEAEKITESIPLRSQAGSISSGIKCR